MVVSVTNVNDNPPTFEMNPCQLVVRELSPPDSLIGSCPAIDADANTRLFYRLSSETEGVKLRSPTSPDILVQKRLDYDEVKSLTLTLYVQDTLPSAGETPPHIATSTVLVTILDIDNRPPWFQPCTKFTVGEDVICQNTGYTGKITMNELEAGELPLKPGPLHAIDGDAGLNEGIRYTIVSGNDANVFRINADSGNISMLIPAVGLTPIRLTVAAAQRGNSFQLATSTVTFNVVDKSLYLPQFKEPLYEGTVTAVGSAVTNLTDESQPLRIQATDEDYPEGVNPNIRYQITGSRGFSLADGFLIMTEDLPVSTFNLQVKAVDTINDESATTEVMVEVTGLPTTTEAPSTTVPTTAGTNSTTIMTTAGTNSTTIMTTAGTNSTTIMTTAGTNSTTIVTTAGTNSTTIAPTAGTNSTTIAPTAATNSSTSVTSDITISTSQPNTTPEDVTPTASTENVRTDPPGGFDSTDMAALGATLGVLLFISLLVIGLLLCRVQRGKADWRKVFEASVFRSSLAQGSSGQKEGIQFTNEAFQKDEDYAGTSGAGGPEKGMASETQTGNTVLNKAILQTAELLHGNSSQADAEKSDQEKEVKPILTKERRVEDGYKAVWFKEDIDPNAKEDVVIIPDRRDQEEEERSSSDREEDEDDGSQVKIPKVGFADTDLDSGLGVKMDDPADDSEEAEM
ncbi:cadherin-related family member 5 isoform X1 [Genypterus blacodes]|uniref:cadherin-related family member 5 isoform X1 n=1 Tax=Genypterus blacodes TaxID=154954 RepID=UPI003F76E175